MTRWVLLSGEFPPDPGGVADYTRAVSEGLARRGHEIHVVAPRSRRGAAPAGLARVHLLSDTFGPRGLLELSSLVRELRPERLFVQYVPHAFGYKALNLGFCAWLLSQSRRAAVWTQFHEVAYPYQGPPWRRTNLLAAGHQAMAALVSRASERRFMTTKLWERPLTRWDPTPPTWLPVPSNVATDPNPEGAAEWRSRLGLGPEVPLVGHFGNYGRLLGPLIRETIPLFLTQAPHAHVLLLGRSAPEFLAGLRAEQAWLGRRVHAPGALSAEDLGAAVQACDLLLQPYEDGVTSRRGSLMAALAVGASVLTTESPHTDPLWRESGALALGPFAPGPLATRAATLLSTPAQRQALGARASALYAETFALERTLDRLEAAL